MKRRKGKAKGYLGATALTTASQAGNLEMVKWLIEHGANVNAQKLNKVCAVYDACEAGKFQVVQYLLSLPQTTARGTCNGANCLYVACQFEEMEVAQLLLDSGRFKADTRRDDGKQFSVRVSPLFFPASSSCFSQAPLRCT
jgi:ankyrin repeat protein